MLILLKKTENSAWYKNTQMYLAFIRPVLEYAPVVWDTGAEPELGVTINMLSQSSGPKRALSKLYGMNVVIQNSRGDIKFS